MTTPPGYPPNGPGYPPGRPYGQQPYNAPAQPYGAPQQPYGPPPGQGFAPMGPQARPPKKKGGAILGCLGLVVLALVAIGIKAGLKSGIDHATGDPDIASVGDCMSGSGAYSLTVAKCTDPSAKYKVLGKVDNKTKLDFDLHGQELCQPYGDVVTAFWKGRRYSGGYILCLGLNK